MNGFHCTFMNYYIDFSNTFHFICWFIYSLSLSKYPFGQILYVNNVIQIGRICLVAPKSSIWSSFVKLVYACNAVIYKICFWLGLLLQMFTPFASTPNCFQQEFLDMVNENISLKACLKFFYIVKRVSWRRIRLW